MRETFRVGLTRDFLHLALRRPEREPRRDPLGLKPYGREYRLYFGL